VTGCDCFNAFDFAEEFKFGHRLPRYFDWRNYSTRNVWGQKIMGKKNRLSLVVDSHRRGQSPPTE
jgi:hypothetical protein